MIFNHVAFLKIIIEYIVPFPIIATIKEFSFDDDWNPYFFAKHPNALHFSDQANTICVQKKIQMYKKSLPR